MDEKKNQPSKGLGRVDEWVTEKIAMKPLLSLLIGVLLFSSICFSIYIVNKEPVVTREVITATNLSQIWMQETFLYGAFGGSSLENGKECVLLISVNLSEFLV